MAALERQMCDPAMFLVRRVRPRRLCVFFTVLGLVLAAGIVLQTDRENRTIIDLSDEDTERNALSTPTVARTTDVSTQPYSPKKVVVLMSLSKCGGSSVGELFNQNPDVFYFFEPLWGLEIDDYQRLSFRLVNSGSHCNVSEDSRIFLTVYMKVIRDPRSVIASRLRAKYSTNSTLQKYTEEHVREAGYQYLCRWMSDNARTQDSITPWLESRFASLRFEDFAANRVVTAERMYSFVGLPPHKQMLNWLSAHTRPALDRKDPWRSLLEWEAIRLIQADPACQKVMKLFGYIPAADKSDLTSDGWASVKPVAAHVVAIS
uniref:Uncharacterized protein n=1 Tax=Branchiostoma floridae TaxID=7739 RepID=C3ZXC5_BRAFL|eukprot:XP_002586794.1 hypothetical protein BRAFLDRAFT_102946 [Branchiostoma floridae]